MANGLSPHLIQLIYDALLKSFWRKDSLRKFLRQCRIAENFLATWANEESKRSFLDRLFEKLQTSQNGAAVLRTMGQFLAEQQTFPDLQKWEDSAIKIQEAHLAVDRLRVYLRDAKEKKDATISKEETQRRFQERRAEVVRSQQDLTKLNDRLTTLSTQIGTAQSGYDFQDWFYDLMDYCEVVNRRPYKHAGREIDGSVTHSGTTYLIELKFQAGQAGAPDIDTFLKKVNDKADNTMGIIVSMSGYSSVAKSEASGPRTPILLLDASHLFLALTGTMPFVEILERVRRHCSQTSQAYLPADEF